uniref:Uncharacterized protein n=1 Tax=Oryza nivara TaxID=4536 RepID=A0A0E0HY46_ORYNI
MRISSKIPGQRLLCGSLQLVLVQKQEKNWKCLGGETQDPDSITAMVEGFLQTGVDSVVCMVRLGVRGIASLEAAVGKGWSGEEIEGEECEDDDVVGACGSHCGHGVDGARRLGFDVPARVLNCFDRYSNEVPQILLHYQDMNRKCSREELSRHMLLGGLSCGHTANPNFETATKNSESGNLIWATDVKFWAGRFSI